MGWVLVLPSLQFLEPRGEYCYHFYKGHGDLTDVLYPEKLGNGVSKQERILWLLLVFTVCLWCFNLTALH